MDSLSDLDQGLIDDPAPQRPAPRLPRPPFPTQPAARSREAATRLTPEATAALAAASAALAAFGAPPKSEIPPAADSPDISLRAEPAAQAATGQQPPVGGSGADVADGAGRDVEPLPDETTASSYWRGRVLTMALLIALMLAGAAAAGWLFRGSLERVLARWHIVR